MLHQDVAKCNTAIIICWIPSRIGIAGNEKVDKTAKAEPCNVLLPHSDFRPNITEFDLWQSMIDNDLNWSGIPL